MLKWRLIPIPDHMPASEITVCPWTDQKGSITLTPLEDTWPLPHTLTVVEEVSKSVLQYKDPPLQINKHQQSSQELKVKELIVNKSLEFSLLPGEKLYYL